MEMVFCFCRECLKALDRLCHESDTTPAFLNAYSVPKCADCGKTRKLVGTRKFQVELMNVEEKDSVHLFTEFIVVRYIKEASETE